MASKNNNTVQLVLYDLSQGMARNLSAQFLGGPEHAIDLIPHTGIVVFGKEYFFGGSGIAVEDPIYFRSSRNMHPISIETLGTTTVSKNEFEDWCVRQQSNNNSGRKFAGQDYDLFENNCNNFSNSAAIYGLKLGGGVPQYILDIPGKFLASPMGQLIRPMLQSMQIQGGNGITPTGRNSSFSSNTTTTTTTSSTMMMNNATSEYNPWANMDDNKNVPKEEEEDPEALKTLTESFGFPLIRAKKGLRNSNGTIEGAVDWIMLHQDDVDIDDSIDDTTTLTA